MKKSLKYKIILCDLDDTLLNDNLKISDADKNAIAEYCELGGVFVLVTGRNLSGVKKYYEYLNLTSAVAINQGSLILLPKTEEVLFEVSFLSGVLKSVCLFLETKDIYFQLFSQGRIFVKEQTFYSRQYIQRCGVTIEETKCDLSLFSQNSKLAFDKLMIECDESIIDDLLNALSAEFKSSLNIFKSKKWIIEVSPLNASKEFALKFCLDYYGIKIEESMAIGDSENDKPMLLKAGFSVAVDNAPASIKAIADYCTKSNNESGVALAIEKYAYV